MGLDFYEVGGTVLFVAADWRSRVPAFGRVHRQEGSGSRGGGGATPAKLAVIRFGVVFVGISTIKYEDIAKDPVFYGGDDAFPKWSKELAERGYKGVSAVEFYDDLFLDDLAETRLPEDYVTGEYCGIAVERVPMTDENGLPVLDKDGNQKYKGRRTQVTKGNKALYALIDRSEEFCLMAPFSYAGRTRTNENARFMYAFCVEVDHIQEKGGLNELVYSWERETKPVPRPTYIVCSGNGLHLYYVFERPVPMWRNVFESMKAYKHYLTPRLWTKYITTAYNKIEYESVNQPFRLVGSKTKEGGFALAFRIGEKVTVDYMNKFAPEEYWMTCVYKSKCNLSEAKKLWPEWYKRRIEEKTPREHWKRHEPIYYNWIEKILDGAEVGHRYNCLENLCSLAVQCNIAPEQVEADCRRIAERFEMLTTDPKNHFTEYDILCALKTYHQHKEQAYRRKIEYISKKTGIELKPNKRNGRKQDKHLFLARNQKAALKEIGEMKQEGRPIGSGTKRQLVAEWRRTHPEGRKIDCQRETGLSRPTVLKWWDYVPVKTLSDLPHVSSLRTLADLPRI